MKKIRVEKMKVVPGKGADRFCASCRRLARNRVTFEDSYGKLVVTLCNVCADKGYEELLLGDRFPRPRTNLIDR
jgi:RNase P subunit RPR2